MNFPKRMPRYAFWAFLLASACLSRTLWAQERPSAAAETGPKTKAGDEEWREVTQKTTSKMHYFLHTGFSFPARLENAIYSYNVETPVIAVVERNIIYRKRVVIPAGTKVIGTVSVTQSHDRALLTFHTLVFPEGDEVKFSGMALSLDGSAGIKGKVETHKDSAVASTVLKSLLVGTQTALDVTGISPVASQATQGVTQEAINELSTQKQQVTTSISIDADTGLRVYVNRRLEY